MVLEKKSSARVEAGQRRVLDDATRQRRLSRQLEALEKDNFQDDPLSSLPPAGPAARLPAFSETEEPERKRRKTRGDHFKQRFRKNFTTLLEEEVGRAASCSSSLSRLPGPAFLPASPSFLLRLWLPFTLHLHHLWGALLQQQVSVHTQRDQVPEVDAVTAALSPWR
ncbi:zinc finger HIT domain-containing protein 1 isoform X1 [Brachionichthys hirsutus]|uniref:zinc finger HIT domain-containing protein 1 isoform X1 n=1 Tax=Brachionichthys hirsutus TaxID=412623 RepID=UPI0036050024